MTIRGMVTVTVMRFSLEYGIISLSFLISFYRTADDILNHCLTQVAQEILSTGDELIQGLYADEFIPVAANHSNTSLLSSPS